MIENISIAAPQKTYKVTPDLEKYINKKIGKLDRHMKKRNKDGARADVKLKESTGKGGKKYTCEVILHTPDYKLAATEATINMFAAVDIVETKLQKQLQKEKDTHSKSNDRRKNSRARKAFGKIFSK